jgi:hypothetical protein
MWVIFLSVPLYIGKPNYNSILYPLSQSIDRSSWTWGDYELVSESCDQDSTYCRIDSDINGNVYVVWDDSSNILSAGYDSDIFLRRWYIENQSWGEIELISDISTLDSNVPTVDVDNFGNIHVAWCDYTPYAVAGADLDVFYRKWDSQTKNWGSYEIISSLSDGASYWPEIYCDESGVVHSVWYDNTNYTNCGDDYDIFYRTRNPDTLFWGTYEVVSDESPSNSRRCDFGVDSNNNIHVVWQDDSDIYSSGADTDVFYRMKSSETGNWENVEVLSTVSSLQSWNPAIEISDNGEIYVVWEDDESYGGAGTHTDIFYRNFDPNLHSWKSTQVISVGSNQESEEVKITKDSEGDLYIVWCEGENYTIDDNDYDVAYRSLKIESGEWSGISIISTESTAYIFQPDITVDGNGFIHVAWEDSTDFTEDGFNQDIFYRRLTGKSIAPTLDPIFPNLNDDGIIYLSWSLIKGVTTYHLYRDVHYITTVETLNPIISTTSNFYTDEISSNGSYYYVLVAENGLYNSSISNVQYVEVKISTPPPSEPSGFFSEINFAELLLFAAIVGVMQVLVVIILKNRKSK